ncbi:Uncharacterized protein Rs2_14272 [Raphanus sativus]|nr:Uncharacterized protein Rs2_14272 [Raphanus sativus]
MFVLGIDAILGIWLLLSVQEIQKRYEMLPDKESVDGGLMLEAEKNDGLDNCAPHLRYALRRLLFVVSFLRERNKYSCFVYCRTHGRTRIVCRGGSSCLEGPTDPSDPLKSDNQIADNYIVEDIHAMIDIKALPLNVMVPSGDGDLVAYNDNRNAEGDSPSQNPVYLADYSWGWRTFLGLDQGLVKKYWKIGAIASFTEELEKLRGPDGKVDPFKKLEDSYKIEFKKQKESYAGIDGMVHVELYEELKMAHEKKCQAGYEELRRKFQR